MSAPEKKIKILVVDDEDQIRRVLKSILGARKYEVILASSGPEAIDRAADHAPDLVILDLAMPEMSGLDVCRELRTWFAAPILVLSVKGSDTDKISALDMGADDYLTKPFSAGELLARVRALLRRSAPLVPSIPITTVGDLEIDIAHRRVRRAGQEVNLTRIEFDILALLVQNADRVITSKMIIKQVWGADYDEDVQTLRVHISNLRKKIEPHSSVPRYILTEPGVGFRFTIS
jgi:two-component system, OmpR family, KDP operon response regulator KdpE